MDSMLPLPALQLRAAGDNDERLYNRCSRAAAIEAVSGRADTRLAAQALDRMGKHEASKVQRMASLYGLRSSMQGAGKRRIVMVRPAETAALVPFTTVRALVELRLHGILERAINSGRNGTAAGAPVYPRAGWL